MWWHRFSPKLFCSFLPRSFCFHSRLLGSCRIHSRLFGPCLIHFILVGSCYIICYEIMQMNLSGHLRGKFQTWNCYDFISKSTSSAPRSRRASVPWTLFISFIKYLVTFNLLFFFVFCFDFLEAFFRPRVPASSPLLSTW